jgi:hypothetical protein
VDAQRLGRREADERNRFTLPPHLALRNLEALVSLQPSPQEEQAAVLQPDPNRGPELQPGGRTPPAGAAAVQQARDSKVWL